MFGRIAVFVSLALLSASCATEAVEKDVVSIQCRTICSYLGSVLTAHLRNSLFLNNSKNTLESRIKMPWQRYWETLNRKASSIPTFAREGARVYFSDCHRGGYGLIQWTTENRYLGLGVFSATNTVAILVHLKVRLNT